jgi:hypothetical protein
MCQSRSSAILAAPNQDDYDGGASTGRPAVQRSSSALETSEAGSQEPVSIAGSWWRTSNPSGREWRGDASRQAIAASTRGQGRRRPRHSRSSPGKRGRGHRGASTRALIEELLWRGRIRVAGLSWWKSRDFKWRRGFAARPSGLPGRPQRRWRVRVAERAPAPARRSGDRSGQPQSE